MASAGLGAPVVTSEGAAMKSSGSHLGCPQKRLQVVKQNQVATVTLELDGLDLEKNHQDHSRYLSVIWRKQQLVSNF